MNLIAEDVSNFISWLLIAVFVTVPVLRIHASLVLWRAYNLEKDLELPSGTTLERLFIAATGSVASIILASLGVLRAGFLVGLIDFEIPAPWGIIGLGVSMI